MDLECSLCRLPYDSKLRAPMILCRQQHLCCKQCSYKLFQKSHRINCPECRQIINSQNVVKFRLYYILEQKFQKEIQNQKQRSKQVIEECKSDYKHIIKDLLGLQGTKDIQYYEAVKLNSQKLLTKGNFETATILLEDLVQKYPNQNTFIGIGSKQEEIGLSQNCDLNWYKQYYRTPNLDAEDILAFIYLRNPQYESQKSFYERLLLRNPTNYKILFGLALTQHNAGNLDKALSLYQKVIDINHNFSKAYQLIAFICLQKQSFEWAQIYCDNCLSIQPKNIFARLIRTAITEDLKEIQQRVKQISQIQPRYARGIYRIGNYFFNIKQYEEAQLNYYTCISINRQYIAPFISLGQCYNSVHSYKQALEILLKISDKAKTHLQTVNYYLQIGKAYKMMNQYDKAVQSFKKCIELEPSLLNVEQQLLQIYLSQNNIQEALRIYQFLAVRQQSPRHFPKIIEFYKKKNNLKDQVYWLNKWLKVEPDNVNIHASLAQAHYKMNNLQLSLLYCQNCIGRGHQVHQHYFKSIQILQKLNMDEQLKKQMYLFHRQCVPSGEAKIKLDQLYQKFFKEIQQRQKCKSMDSIVNPLKKKPQI